MKIVFIVLVAIQISFNSSAQHLKGTWSGGITHQGKEWNIAVECGSGARRRLCFYHPIMEFNDLSADSQSNAGTMILPVVKPFKQVEYSVGIRRIETDTVIFK